MRVSCKAKRYGKQSFFSVQFYTKVQF